MGSGEKSYNRKDFLINEEKCANISPCTYEEAISHV